MENIIEVSYLDQTFQIAWSFAFIDDMDYSLLLSSLSAQERKTAEKFPVTKRTKEFIAGRYCTKRALALYTPGIASHNMTTGIGVWGHPFIAGSDVNISIAHTDKCVIAICTSGAFPVGIDIEDCKQSNDALIHTQVTEAEKKMTGLFPGESEGLHILWAAKEAVAKALHTGFRLPMPFFEVSHVIKQPDAWHIKFDSIGVLSVIAINTRSGVIALALPTGSVVMNGLDALRMVQPVYLQQKQGI